MIQAKHYTKGRQGHTPNLIILHTMESPEKPDTAESVARWFAGATAPQTSIHSCVDSNSAVTCVADQDTAWHSGVWDVNVRSLGIELAGKASQTDRNWHDEYSVAELRQAAKVAAAWCLKYNIPVRHLTPAEVKAGKAGICGHVDVTKGFAVSGGHTDPGVAFPWIDFLQLVIVERFKITHAAEQAAKKKK